MALALTLLMLGVVLWQAPASWADALVSRLTEGRLRLTQAQGGLWNGQAHILVADPLATQSGRAVDGFRPQGVALAPQLIWRLSPLPLLLGQISGLLQFSGQGQGIPLEGNFRHIKIGAGQLNLPAMELDRLGSPWNTLQPRVRPLLKWQAFELREGQFRGQAELELAEVSSAMTPVNPLGHYRVTLNGLGDRADLSMQTLSGPLMLSGQGQWNLRQGLRFTAVAEVAEQERLRLLPLLGFMGKRDGERTIIKIGA
jgi:general secretion pathway protein N